MFKILVFLFIYTSLVSLLLGLSIGIAFLLSWLFPNISFEIGMVIGAICNGFSIYIYAKVVITASNPKHIFGEEEHDQSLNLHENEIRIIPAKPKSTRVNKRQKR